MWYFFREIVVFWFFYRSLLFIFFWIRIPIISPLLYVYIGWPRARRIDQVTIPPTVYQSIRAGHWGSWKYIYIFGPSPWNRSSDYFELNSLWLEGLLVKICIAWVMLTNQLKYLAHLHNDVLISSNLIFSFSSFICYCIYLFFNMICSNPSANLLSTKLILV